MKQFALIIFVLSLLGQSSWAGFNQNSLNEAVISVSRVKSHIRRAANAFGIPAEFIAGAILSEHAYNVNWQDAYQNARIRSGWQRRLLTGPSNRRVLALIDRSDIEAACSTERSNYNYWYCVMRTETGASWHWPPAWRYKSFVDDYFNPDALGATFGLGQLSPLRAMMVSDRVAARTNIPEINFRNEASRSQMYSDLLNPQRVVYYVAATISLAIQIYGAYGFDISDDLGVAVTLYNIGNEHRNALDRRREGGSPQPNQLGRWAEANIELIENALR